MTWAAISPAKRSWLVRSGGSDGRQVGERRPASAALYGVIVISAVTVAIGSVSYNGRLRAALSESLHQKSLAEEQRPAAEQQTVLARDASVRISTRSGQWPIAQRSASGPGRAE